MTKKSEPLPQSRFSWWAKNLAAVVLVAVVCTKAPGLNDGYNWLLNSYVKGNLETVRLYGNMTTEQRLQAKLGNDYSYLMFLRDNTPADAVILYPTRDQFRAGLGGQPSLFQGNLCDKLAAVRVLYPRKVVVHEEMGKSSWSKRITHIGIMNGQNRDLLAYPVDSTYTIGVLPVQAPVQQSNTQP